MARMRTMKLPSRDRLKELFRYDPKTGKLFWRKRPRMMFNSPDACKGWNARFAEREAFTYVNKGYRRGMLFRQSVYAHQIIFKMMVGIDVAEVDHIDGDRLNNSWSNLRPVPSGTNQRNCTRRVDNTSGQMGVVQRGERWIAQVGHDGTTKHIGIYDTKAEAIAARKAAEIILGFHPNHGRNEGSGPGSAVKVRRRGGEVIVKLGSFDTKEEAVAAYRAAEKIRDRREDFSNDDPTYQ
jgi:hypothetical protein